MVNGLGHLGFYLGRLLHIVINCDDDETQKLHDIAIMIILILIHTPSLMMIMIKGAPDIDSGGQQH